LTGPIYHLAEPGDWAGSTDEYRAPSLEAEGFIHCSTADQLADVAVRHFTDHNDLILLAVDPEPLGDAVVFEDLYELGEEYPHVYGPIPTTAVLTTSPYLAHLEEGLWRETRADPGWMDRILHPNFVEVGRSGRTYHRQEAIETTHYPFGIELPLRDFEMDLIDEDVALVRYVSRETREDEMSPAHRTSVWVNTNEGWRLRFHQGTPLP
jgi:uncharacterized protein (DUF952 family)